MAMGHSEYTLLAWFLISLVQGRRKLPGENFRVPKWCANLLFLAQKPQLLACFEIVEDLISGATFGCWVGT